jgi:hypothetical protein
MENLSSITLCMLIALFKLKISTIIVYKLALFGNIWRGKNLTELDNIPEKGSLSAFIASCLTHALANEIIYQLVIMCTY